MNQGKARKVILIFFIEFTICLLSSAVVLEEINGNDVDKLILSPAKFANLVLQQAAEINDPQEWPQNSRKPKYPVSYGPQGKAVTLSSELTTELSDDESRLKARKVWSRWGKWGECSVTCGDGVMSRQRVCLEGRCAPGERERQCRPCARSPCHTRTLSDDTHDLE